MFQPATTARGHVYYIPNGGSVTDNTRLFNVRVEPTLEYEPFGISDVMVVWTKSINELKFNSNPRFSILNQTIHHF